MKKIYASIVLLVGAIVPYIASAQTYTAELQSAYNYAYSIGITTMPTIDSANMYGNLIRAHMAKMMVNYAKNVLGKTADTSLSCNFTDVANQSTELQGYIKEACQMGLMGQGITAFDPNGVVTRAQFGTVLSRALREHMFDGADPYYKDHLQALKDMGIMTKIDTPSANEMRGWVMVMMMRAVEGAGGDTSCDDPEIKFYCSLELDLCPSQCKGESTTAGTLNISSTTIDPGTLPANSTYIGSLRFVATESNISLKSLTFQKIGSFTKGRIEDDGVTIASIQALSTDSSTTVAFSPPVTITQGEPKTLSIFIEDNGDSDQGLNLSNIQSISSSANSVDGGFPLRLVK